MEKGVTAPSPPSPRQVATAARWPPCTPVFVGVGGIGRSSPSSALPSRCRLIWLPVVAAGGGGTARCSFVHGVRSGRERGAFTFRLHWLVFLLFGYFVSVFEDSFEVRAAGAADLSLWCCLSGEHSCDSGDCVPWSSGEQRM